MTAALSKEPRSQPEIFTLNLFCNPTPDPFHSHMPPFQDIWIKALRISGWVRLILTSLNEILIIHIKSRPIINSSCSDKLIRLGVRTSL